MLKVPVSRIRDGMTLARPVENPQVAGGYLLLGGYELSERMASRLDKSGVSEVWVKYPGMAEVFGKVNADIFERRREAAKHIQEAFEAVQNNALASMNYDGYLKAMVGLVEEMLRNPTAVMFVEEAAGVGDVLMRHSATVSYLSLLLGVKLETYLANQRTSLQAKYAVKVGNLGIGGMLHDIGMLQLDPAVRERHEATGDFEDAAWRAHARLGYDMVKNRIEPSAAAAVLHHHQHFDGSGFPKHRGTDEKMEALSGEKIHVFARIVAVADMFDGLKNPAGGEARSTVEALGMLIQKPYTRWIDPKVLEAFMAVVPAYAPGTMVKLGDGRWATPVDHHADAPCRPTVQLVDLDGQAANESIVDLRMRADLEVVEAEGMDVRCFNFEAPALPKAEEILADVIAAA